MPSGEPFFSLRARDYLGYPGLNGMAGFAARTTAQVFKIGDLVRVPDRSGSVTIGASFHLDFGAGSLKSCLHSDHRLLPRDIATRNIFGRNQKYYCAIVRLRHSGVNLYFEQVAIYLATVEGR
jgi:hypothetical protein